MLYSNLREKMMNEENIGSQYPEKLVMKKKVPEGFNTASNHQVPDPNENIQDTHNTRK